MDILVRVPKSEKEHFWEDVPPDNISWWTLHVRPKNLEEGDYIWFLIDSEVQARAKIDSIVEGELECDSTGRDWDGVHVCWIARDLEKLDDPLEGYSLPRGFKYFDQNEKE